MNYYEFPVNAMLEDDDQVSPALLTAETRARAARPDESVSLSTYYPENRRKSDERLMDRMDFLEGA